MMCSKRALAHTHNNSICWHPNYRHRQACLSNTPAPEHCQLQTDAFALHTREIAVKQGHR